jgi:hypothetical protein
MASAVPSTDPMRQVFAEGLGVAPSLNRMRGRKILVVGGGQRTIPDPDPPIGNGRARARVLSASTNPMKPRRPSATSSRGRAELHIRTPPMSAIPWRS